MEPLWTDREFREPTNLIQMQDGRMLVTEQSGRIWAFDPAGGAVPAATEFLDITDRVSSRRSEEGLLGLALDPRQRGAHVRLLLRGRPATVGGRALHACGRSSRR